MAAGGGWGQKNLELLAVGGGVPAFGAVERVTEGGQRGGRTLRLTQGTTRQTCRRRETRPLGPLKQYYQYDIVTHKIREKNVSKIYIYLI